MNRGLVVEFRVEQRCTERSSSMIDWLTLLHLQCPTSLQAPGPLGSSSGEGLEGMLVCGAGPGCNNASSAVSRCRQSDLPGTPRRIRATSAGTVRGATWGDVSHVALTSQEHGSGGPWEKCWWLLFWVQEGGWECQQSSWWTHLKTHGEIPLKKLLVVSVAL